MKKELKVGDTKVQVGLDRLVIGIPYPKQPKQNLTGPVTQEQIAKFIADKKEFVSGMKYIESMIVDNFPHYIGKTQNKDLKRINVLSESGGLLCTFSLGFSFGTGVVNLEMNPSKMCPNKWTELFGCIDLFFSNGYHELYTKGVVSHAEFFVDVSEEDLAGLVLLDEGRRATTHYNGTTYLGKRSSPHVTTIYDKAKEQKKDEKLVRVEERINRRDIRLQDLVENDLFNPFSNSMVVNVNQVQIVSNEFNKSKFVNHIKEFGLSGSGINIHSRKKMLARLKENTVDWWQPELFWATHREMLMKFKPNHVGGIA